MFPPGWVFTHAVAAFYVIVIAALLWIIWQACTALLRGSRLIAGALAAAALMILYVTDLAALL